MPTIGEMLAGSATQQQPRKPPLAGVLPAVFSAGDKLKRFASDFMADPVGNIQQRVGFLNDQAGQFNQLHSQATQEAVQSLKSGGDGWGPASQQLAGKLADAYNPAGMVVWHGSPHKFAKFDSSKIGTGEGAQAYGHGLYLAESPDVAKSYMTANDKLSAGEYALREHGLDLAATKKALHEQYRVKRDQEFAGRKNAPELAAMFGDARQSTIDALKDLRNTSLYKVDLPDDAIAKMLDWDKPLSQQAPEVQRAIGGAADDATGTWLYNTIAGKGIVQRKYGGEKGAVEAYLRDQGIPGIRYLDGGSRGAGAGTSNFVVFPGNESLLQILERNGIPVN